MLFILFDSIPSLIQLIDILDAKAIAKKIPVVEGKGPYFPPWTWRTSLQKVREWRELTAEQQIQEKSAWSAMGMAKQDIFIRDVRIKNQAKTFWLLAQNGGTSAQPPSTLHKAREDFIQVYCLNINTWKPEGWTRVNRDLNK